MRRTATGATLIGVLTSLSWGCAEDPNTSADPQDYLPAAEYCTSIADFFCDFYTRCRRMSVPTGRTCHAVFMESCQGRWQPRYEDLERAGLMRLSREGVQACEQHLAAVPCNVQILELDGPCATMWEGQQSAGGACSMYADGVEALVCADGHRCSLTMSFCGTCREVAQPGEVCSTDGDCGTNASCNSNDRCVADLNYGDPCQPTDTCRIGASCTGGVCVGPTYVGFGDACDAGRRCPYVTGCIGGTCQRTALLDEACSGSVPCETGWCDGGTCAALRVGAAPCSDNAQCATGSCTGSTCDSLPGACFP